MNTAYRIVLIVIAILLIFVISMILAGKISDKYGWDVFLRVADKKESGAPFAEYRSGNSNPTDPNAKVIFTNDHSLGQLYSVKLGDVPQSQVMYTKSYTGDLLLKGELRRFLADPQTEYSITLAPLGTKVNPNGTIVQPGQVVDYHLNIYDRGATLPKATVGIKGSVMSRTDGAVYTLFHEDGRTIISFPDGTKTIQYPEGKIEHIDSAGNVTSTDPASGGLIVTTGTVVAPSQEGFANGANYSDVYAYERAHSKDKSPQEYLVETFAPRFDYAKKFSQIRGEGFTPQNPMDYAKTYAKNFSKAAGSEGNSEGYVPQPPLDYSEMYAEMKNSPPVDYFTPIDYSKDYRELKDGDPTQFAIGTNTEGFYHLGGKLPVAKSNKKEGFANGANYSDVYAYERAHSKDKSPAEFLVETLDVESTIGVADPGSTEFLYEITREDLTIDDYVPSIEVELSSDGVLGTVATGAIPTPGNFAGEPRSGNEGYLSYPDKYYVDAAGNTIYRRKRYVATNDNFYGWNGPYVDVYGNVQFDGYFEPVHGARINPNWVLPAWKTKTRSGNKISATWAPHTHKMTSCGRREHIFNSEFNSATQEMLTDAVTRRDPIGAFLVKPSYDMSFIIE